MSKEPATRAAFADDGESIALMEPMLLAQASRHRGPLTDLAVELAARAAGLRRSLPQGVSAALADLVRAMNCYYSNLIEGHNTHPVDIERALQHDYSADPRARNLQLEAVAHIAVQRWMDDGGLAGRTTTAEGLCELHRHFCTALPQRIARRYGWRSQPRLRRTGCRACFRVAAETQAETPRRRRERLTRHRQTRRGVHIKRKDAFHVAISGRECRFCPLVDSYVCIVLTSGPCVCT